MLVVFQRHKSGLKRIKECAPKYRVILPLPEIVFIIKYGKWNTNSKYTTWRICFCNKILTVSYNFTSILNQNFEKKTFLKVGILLRIFFVPREQKSHCTHLQESQQEQMNPHQKNSDLQQLVKSCTPTNDVPYSLHVCVV